MKKLILASLFLISINLISQDTISIRKFSLAVGPTWGTLGWGGNVSLSYSVSKKINFRISGIYSSGKNFIFSDQQNYAGIRKTPITNVSISANYFLIGNTNPDCKASLYIGLGLGYLQQTSNTTNLYPGNLFLSNNPNGSYIEKDVSRGLAANTKIGAAFKLGPGKLYIETYFSISFVGETTYTYTFMNQFTSPATPPEIASKPI